MQPVIIGIAGESGVGKTVVANILRRYLGEKKTLLISTDDLHKWERNSVEWVTSGLTHLDPSANNLDVGDAHLKALSEGKSIERSIYDHNSGRFLPPVTLAPKEYIINEGLHSFHTDFAKSITNLKIFIDVNKSLKNHWKIIRDMRDRGYSLKQVKKNIELRKKDAKKLKKQALNSDVIIRISPISKIKKIGNPFEVVFTVADFELRKGLEECEIIRHIKDYYSSINDLVFLSHTFGNDENYVLGKGGNISVKIGDNDLAIKSSGVRLKDVSFESGYTLINRKSFSRKLKYIVDDESLDKQMERLSGKQKHPSMETFCHLALNNKYVIHTHPKYLTALLSSTGARKIIKKIFQDFKYKFISYKNPGFDLGAEINKYPDYGLFFLENHGLIVAEENPYVAKAITECIEHTAKNFCLYCSDLHGGKSFPDAIIFENDDDISERNLFTVAIANAMGEKGYKLISKKNQEKILNMSAEKRRKQ